MEATGATKAAKASNVMKTTMGKTMEDDGNKIKTLVDTIHTTTTRRKDTPEMKRTKHLAATSKTTHGDTKGETKNLINIICTAKLNATWT